MKKPMLLAAAATMAISIPTVGQAQGKGKGASAKAQQSKTMSRNAKSYGQVRPDVKARTDARANVRARTRTGASVNRLDVNRDGVVDVRDRSLDRNRDGVIDRATRQYGGDICPPGLAKKTPSCVPPGQARGLFREGQRLPDGYNYTDYNMIPEAYRTRVPYSDGYRYIYRDDRVYVVDPTTRLVTNIINLMR